MIFIVFRHNQKALFVQREYNQMRNRYGIRYFLNNSIAANRLTLPHPVPCSSSVDEPDPKFGPKEHLPKFSPSE